MPLIRLLLLLMLCLSAPAHAELGGSRQSTPSGGLLDGIGGQAAFLPVHEAFRAGILASDAERIVVQFDMAPGYYLYRHRLGFALLDSGDPERGIASMELPEGIHKTDEFFGDVEVYYDQLTVTLRRTPAAAAATRLSADFQGCADAGLCYPPETLTLALPGAAGAGEGTASLPGDGGLQGLLAGERFGLALLLFFLAGLGLTFTPCVLPMLPILSALVLGRKDIDRVRASLLALSYVLGMAISFALVGALIGVFGAALNIQARLQSPWVLGTFAVFFVIFALAMFGLFDLRLPRALREPLERLGSRTRGGSIPGAAVMGVLSTLVVSPCISAPLAGALVYISTTGDALGGALSLFVLALGMGVPLLLVAIFGSALLPRSGAWLEAVKQLFGFGLLGVAIWLLERVLPGPLSLTLWAALAAGLAVQFGLLDRTPRSGRGRVSQTLALLAAIYAGASLFGALGGGSDPLRPLHPFTGGQTNPGQDAFFTTVTDQSGIRRELEQAAQLGRPAVVELYADWCISCKVIEREVLGDADVRQALQNLARVKLDLTDNTLDQRSWLSAQGLFGPPAFLFFDPAGNEQLDLRVQGEIDRSAFLSRLEALSGR
jgi:thioredoxin:protein disulfide reductase